MATFEENLKKIKNAVYGKDVRNAIHDAIQQASESSHAPGINSVVLTFNDDTLTIKTVKSDGTMISDTVEISALATLADEVGGMIVKDDDTGLLTLRLVASHDGEIISDTYVPMPFTGIQIDELTVEESEQPNKYIIALDYREVTDVNTIGAPIVSNKRVESSLDLSALGINLTIRRYNAESGEYETVTATDEDDPIMAFSAIQNSFVAQNVIGKNRILIADNDVSGILPVNKWRAANTEIKEELIGQLDGINIIGYVVDDGYLAKDLDDALAIKVPVESGIYTVFYREDGELYNSFWNNKMNGLLVSNREDIGDAADVGMVEFIPNSVLYSGFSNANVLKKGIRTSGMKGYYAVITVPAGGHWVYFDSDGVFIDNVYDSSLAAMHGTNAVIMKGDITDNDDDALIKKYISQIGNWEISDNHARAEILSIKAKIEELEAKINALTN